MITWEELLELGCPPGLCIQYIFSSRAEICEMVYKDRIMELVNEMKSE